MPHAKVSTQYTESKVSTQYTEIRTEKNILELCCSTSKIARNRRLKFGNEVEKTTHKLV